MDFAGARKRAARTASAVRRSRNGSAGRESAAELTVAVRARPRPPAGARSVRRALCEETGTRRDGRAVELRFERFPDEIEVTGPWVELNPRTAAAADQVPAGETGRRDAVLAGAARSYSRERGEAEAGEFGHRPATAFRRHLSGQDADTPPLHPLHRSPGYRGRPGAAR
jgi:hypothetical protein